MIDWNEVTTLLFDLDNTLIVFDEQEFIPLYGKNIHAYFTNEIPSYEEFMKLFLTSTHMMLEKEPKGLTNLEKFAAHFSPRINLPSEEIIERFLQFYNTHFDQISQVISPAPFAESLLELASQHFDVVAATNPLFPRVATEKRLNWGKVGLTKIPWLEITVADEYYNAKPYLSYYEEVLERIDRSPEECVMIGNDKVNDMIAGKLGIKTYFIDTNISPDKIITTELDREQPEFPIDESGSLEDLYLELKEFISNKKKNY
jgi:FMN phosphatase YigB (HAD superfamily)